MTSADVELRTGPVPALGEHDGRVPDELGPLDEDARGEQHLAR